MIKRCLKTLAPALLLPLRTFAMQSAPTAATDKIVWAIENCGPMPKAMIIGFALLIITAIITVMLVKRKGADKHE